MLRISRLTALVSLALAVACNDDDTVGDDGIGVSLSSESESLAPGNTLELTVTVNRIAAVGGAVSLSATGLPAGVTATFAPANIPEGAVTSTLTLTAAPTANTGTATVTIRAQGSDDATGLRTLQLSITGENTPAITLVASPNIIPLTPGGSAISTVAITRSGGFTGDVVLSVDGVPTGVTASFAPASIPNGGTTSLLTFTAIPGVTQGTSNLTLRATGAGIDEQTVSLQLMVSGQ